VASPELPFVPGRRDSRIACEPYAGALPDSEDGRLKPEGGADRRLRRACSAQNGQVGASRLLLETR
jgi:hypothetical protein